MKARFPMLWAITLTRGNLTACKRCSLGQVPYSARAISALLWRPGGQRRGHRCGSTSTASTTR
jgi:hypothetical protein